MSRVECVPGAASSLIANRSRNRASSESLLLVKSSTLYLKVITHSQ